MYITNPKEIHFALKNMEGVVTSVNVEYMRYLINVKQPDGSRNNIWFDSDEFSEELGKIDQTGTGFSSSVYKRVNYTVKDDPVNHPSHYTDGKYEVIDFIEDWRLDMDFRLGNAAKYICRAGKKNTSTKKEDLEKALWYLNRYHTNGTYSHAPADWYEMAPRQIDLMEFIRDKELEGTQPGFALEAICHNCIPLAIHILEAYINTL